MATNSNSSYFRNRSAAAAGSEGSEKTEKPAREHREDRGEGRSRDDRPKRAYTDRPARPYSDRGDRPARSFDKSDRGDRPARDDKGRFAPREDRPSRPYSDRGDRPARSFDKSSDRGDRPSRPYSDRGDRPARSFDKSSDRGDRPSRPYSDRGDRPARSFDKSSDRGDRPSRPYSDRGDRPARSFDKSSDRGDRPSRPYSDRGDRPARSFDKSSDRGDRPSRPYSDRGDRPARSFDKSDRPSRDDKGRFAPRGEGRPYNSNNTEDRSTWTPRPARDDKGRFEKRSFDKPFDAGNRPEREPRTGTVPDWVRESAPKSQAVRQEEREAIIAEARADRKAAAFEANRAAIKAEANNEKLTQGVGPKRKNEEMRLNRFIAQSGICSRREADSLIEQGLIKVNGEVVTELGVKINPAVHSIEYNGKQLSGERLVYIIMNKPKGYVTSVEDPHNDLTVMTILGDKVKERVYPVGRLDKHTTGVLLLTNDGELTMKLTHPSFEQRKIYHAFLDKPCTVEHITMLANGIELEDGEIHADEVSFVDGNKKEVGIEIHSGRNRIVRRMFEHLDYKVVKLDRVFFAGFTKLGLRRGYWRYLSPKEIITLRNL